MAEQDPVVTAARAKVAQIKQEAITQRRLRVSARMRNRFTKPIDRFIGISDQELQDLWDRADSTAGEQVGGFRKGEISQEIENRAKKQEGE